VSGRSQYMREYYANNRESILAQRKKRYKNDPEFRAKQNELRRKSRKRKALFDHKDDHSSSAPKATRMRVSYQGDYIQVDMYTVAQFCRHVGLQRPRVSKWYDAGWLKRPTYSNNLGHLLYTEYEFEGLTKIIRSHRMSQAARGYKFKADQDLKDAIQQFYSTLEKGLPINGVDKD